MADKAALGVVRFGDTPATVGELRAWRQTSEPAEIDTTIMGSGNARTQPGAVRHSMEVDLFFDLADAGQVLVRAQQASDTPQAVAIYPLGVGIGLPQWLADAFVGNVNAEGSADGAVEMSCTFYADENGGAWSAQT